jgi:hypothetical protein
VTSGFSTQSSSSTNSPHPGHLKRRSTDASGGLDYYFSNEAGQRNGPNSSSSSSLLSLGISPSPSGGILPSFAHPERMRSKSSVNLRESASGGGLHLRNDLPHLPQSGVVFSGSNGKDQTEGYESAGSTRVGEGQRDLDLTSGWSDSSDYSENESGTEHSSKGGVGLDSATSEIFGGQRPWEGMGSHKPLFSPNREDVARASITSSSTYHVEPKEEDTHRTPIPSSTQERVDLKAPRYAPPQPVKTHSPIPDIHSTPTRSASEQSTYTPGSGRLPITAVPYDTSRRTGDHGISDSPRSAPAWQSEFGISVGAADEDGQGTVKGRNRMSIPSISTASSGALVEAALSPEKTMLSPDRYESGRTTPIRGSFDKGSSAKSPEPPPRSNKRTQ